MNNPKITSFYPKSAPTIPPTVEPAPSPEVCPYLCTPPPPDTNLNERGFCTGSSDTGAMDFSIRLRHRLNLRCRHRQQRRQQSADFLSSSQMRHAQRNTEPRLRQIEHGEAGGKQFAIDHPVANT